LKNYIKNSLAKWHVRMSNFKLDPRLKKDCIVLGKLNGINLLLMNNALVPWFILVPETKKIEIYELGQDEQDSLYKTISEQSLFIKSTYSIEKLNVAAIGNIVRQLHIHVVGRQKGDYCWPNVVWGTKEKQEYRRNQIKGVTENIASYFGCSFKINELLVT
jgi:diadenosine tetraphosphate (Ap4A) HIT family hydrolase